MSHPRHVRAPFSDRAVSPSPAQDALQNNLDSSRTLTTKKSWLGSARDMISRHVSMWKSEEPKTTPAREENAEDGLNEDDGDSIPREHSGSNDSTTPLRPRSERQRTFTPKSAVNSLRQHIHSSRGQRKRGSLGEITGSAIQVPVDPGSLAALEECTRDSALTRQHTRKNSLGKSLVGSIRNLGRQSLQSHRISPTGRMSQDGEALLPPIRGAAEIPLPSSPISIPPPPTLQIDLGPAALVTSSFGRPPGVSNTSQREQMIDLRNLVTGSAIGQVSTCYTRPPGEGTVYQEALVREKKDSLQPRDLLQLPLDEFDHSIPSESTIPMAGAGGPLELDGSNDPSEIFERSLEYKDKAKKKEDRKLKKMVSLDAMAEECASVSPARSTPGSNSPRMFASLGITVRKTSRSTISALPDEMPPLSRQMAHLQTSETGHRDPNDGRWKSEDPFAPSNEVCNLATAPAPGKSIKLPFRPKITLQSADSTEAKTLRLSNEVIMPNGDPMNFGEAQRITTNMLNLDGAADSSMRSIQRRNGSTIASLDGLSPIETECYGAKSERNIVRPSDIPVSSGESRPDSPGSRDPGEYSEFKTRHIFGDLNVAEEPEYHDIGQTEATGLIESLHHSPSVKRIHERISKSNTSSPHSFRSGTAQKTDVADIFWKSSVDDWMSSSNEGDTGNFDIAPSPCRDTMDHSSAVSSAGGEHPTPNPSPTTTTPDRNPMGNRVDFDLKRSMRNMRYNALNDTNDQPDHESAASDPTSIPAAWGRKLRIMTGSYRKWQRSHSSTGIEDAGSSMKTNSRYSAVNLSSDSITADLKDAIAEHYIFQSAMADLGPEECSTPTASSSQALLDGAACHGELCPSDSAQLWASMEHSVFDTPTGGSNTASPASKHHLESQECIDDGEPEQEDEIDKLSSPEQTLDDCLEMFHHYNSFQVLSSDPPEASEKIMNPFRSRKRGSNASASPASPLPARVRSQNGRR